MTSAWYAAMTVPARERYAASMLLREGLTVFLPECIEQVQDHRSGKLYKRRAIMFPGYLFSHFDRDSEAIGIVRRTPGVAQVLENAGHAQPIKADYISELQERVRSDGGAIRLDNSFRFQEKLRVTEGPLMDRVGTFLWTAGTRLALLMSIFKSSIVVELASSQVQRA